MTNKWEQWIKEMPALPETDETLRLRLNASLAREAALREGIYDILWHRKPGGNPSRYAIEIERKAQRLIHLQSGTVIDGNVIPAGFELGDLIDVANSLESGYDRTVNIGDVDGEGDTHIESTTAYAARFIKTILAKKGV